MIILKRQENPVTMVLISKMVMEGMFYIWADFSIGCIMATLTSLT